MHLQTLIVLVIVAIAAFLMIRRFYNSVRSKGDSSTCGCGCDGCAPSQKQNCTEIEDKIA
jgi:hypothetical protein